MTRLQLTQMALTFVTCAALAAACGGGGVTQPLSQPTVPPAATAPPTATVAPAATVAPQATQPPAATKQPSGGAVAQPATAQPTVSAAQGDACGEDADQALQQLDKDLSNVDTLDNIHNPADTAVDQSLDQLDKSLSNTNTLSDWSK